MANRKRPGKGARGPWAVALLVLAAAGVFVALVGAWLMSPTNTSATAVPVTVTHGETWASVGRHLKKKGVLRHEAALRIALALRGGTARLQPGRYALSPGLSARQVLDVMVQGPNDDANWVTIPEGYTVAQVAATLEARGVVHPRSAFLQVAGPGGTGANAPYDLPKSGLEGYLFPDTYRFAPGSSPTAVAQEMLSEFTRRFYDAHRQEIEQSGHTLGEIVTVASLVEREAEVDRDRPLIAGVIWNRLRKGMRLQIDATVLYAMGHHKSRVLYKDLHIDSPYNTYRVKGLPPGPIACPGMPSLLAALRPEDHGYLFYVAQPDRSHKFTRTEKEHLAAVLEMRRRRASATGG